MALEKVQRPRKRLNWFNLVMILLVLGGCYVLASQYMEQRQVQLEIERNQQLLKEQQEVNHSLKDEKARLNDPEEVEKRAREDLGLVKPGEVPVRTIPAKSPNKLDNP